MVPLACEQDAQSPISSPPVGVIHELPLRCSCNALQYGPDDGSLLIIQRHAEDSFIALAAEDAADGGDQVGSWPRSSFIQSLFQSLPYIRFSAALHHGCNQWLMLPKLLPPAGKSKIRLPALGAVRSSLAALSLLAGNVGKKIVGLP
jgi:hypothetical protein